MLIRLRHRPDAAGCWGLVASRHWSVSPPDQVGRCLEGFCLLGEALVIHPLAHGWTAAHPHRHSLRIAFVLVRRVWILVTSEVAACPYSRGLTLLLGNVVNRAKSNTQVG